MLTTHRIGSLHITTRTDLAAWLMPLLELAPEGFAGHPVEWRTAGRGTVAIIDTYEHQVLVRPYRRGGLAARLLRDVYFGARPRPLRELEVSEALRARGAPVVETFGAAVHWITTGCYRGWLATRFLPNAQTLWQWAQHPSVEFDRLTVFRAAGEAIALLHRCGGMHADLNLNNILVDAGTATLRITLIDLDRASLERAPANLDKMLERLRRSAQRLDPAGRTITPVDLSALLQAARSAAGHE